MGHKVGEDAIHEHYDRSELSPQSNSNKGKKIRKGILYGTFAFFMGTVGAWIMGKNIDHKQASYSQNTSTQASMELSEKQKQEITNSIKEDLTRISSFTSKAAKKDWNSASDYEVVEMNYTFEHRIVQKLMENAMTKIVSSASKLDHEQKKHLKIELNAIKQEVEKMSRLGLAPEIHGKIKGGNHIFDPKNIAVTLDMINICLQNI